MTNIKELLADTFLINETSSFSKNMLDKGVDINAVCRIVKAYITMYNNIKQETELNETKFTMKEFNNYLNSNDKLEWLNKILK
tara:strand:- start:246 stop:494 length:249 start_codon:yes stop_codon:yes gene_type:complete